MSDPAMFWQFSLKYYAQPGIAGTCLTLQDHLDLDVNVLLFILWQAREGRCLDDADLQRVVSFVESWRANVVCPLRQVRRFLKSPDPGWDAKEVEAFRERIKKEELQAERMQQMAMASKFAGVGKIAVSPSSAARVSLSSYARSMKVELPETDIQTLIDGLSHI